MTPITPSIQTLPPATFYHRASFKTFLKCHMPQEGFQNDTPERGCAPHLLLDTRVIQVILSRVLTRLLSSELAHMGTTDGRNQYTKLGAPKALGSYKRGQPLFIAGSPGALESISAWRRFPRARSVCWKSQESSHRRPTGIN